MLRRYRFGIYLGLTLSLGLADWAHGQTLDNARVRVSFDVARGALTQLLDKELAHDFRDATASADLWRIDTGATSTPCILPSMAKASSYRADPASRECMTLEWSQFGLSFAPELRVTATIALRPDSALSVWRIRVKGMDTVSIKAIHFPCIGPIAAQDREALAAPVWIGEESQRGRALVHDAAGAPKRVEWQYPGILSMQWLAFSAGSGAGFYIASNDTGALSKRFAVVGHENNGIGFEVVHQPEQRAGVTDYLSPYDVLVGGFRGDWFTAAAMYREWAQRQSWVKESRLRQGLVPKWAQNTALWEWNRGPSPGVLGPAIELQKALDAPVNVFWHWWHGCPYDVGFPEYFPPREGASSFRDAVAEARKQGIREVVYMNQRLWGMTTKSWTEEGAQRFAVKGMDGKPLSEVYNVFTKAPCAPMCIGTSFWREKYAGLATRAIKEFGVGGIYMDQACASLPCYDPTHGHPLGGGHYWIDGFRTLADAIRARCAAVQPALAGEGCGEAWLPYLDLMLSLQVSMERYAAPGDWSPLPLFQAVYHDSAIQFGNYSSLTMPPYDALWPAEFAPEKPLALLDRRFSAQFRLEQARALAWGQQPALANFQANQLTDRAEEMNFVFKLARVRVQWRPYLQYGVLLGIPDLGAPLREIPISRLSIYAGQQEHLREYTKACPTVLASVWRSPTGSVALIAVNISEAPVKASVDLRPYLASCPRDATASVWEDADRKDAGTSADWLSPHTVEIPAQGVWRVEIGGAK